MTAKKRMGCLRYEYELAKPLDGESPGSAAAIRSGIWDLDFDPKVYLQSGHTMRQGWSNVNGFGTVEAPGAE